MWHIGSAGLVHGTGGGGGLQLGLSGSHGGGGGGGGTQFGSVFGSHVWIAATLSRQ
jgi:hypothetical protein